MTTQDWINVLTPVIGPLLTVAAKTVVPKIPKPYLPWIAIAFAMASNLVATRVTGGELDYLLAGALGLAGIGVREATEAVNPLSAKNKKHSVASD